MQKEKKESEFKPRTVAVKNLYEENVRLQKLCAAHRRQIRGMQKSLELYKAHYKAHVLGSALKTLTGTAETLEEHA